MPEILSPFTRRPRESVGTAPLVLARPDDLERLLEDDGLAGWIADELMQPGAVLSPTAIDDAPVAPAIGRSVITTMVRRTLRDAHPVVERLLPAELRAEAVLAGAGSEAHARLEQGARLLARLVLHFWAAVRTAYSAAWADRDGHVLFTTEGLTALSRLGAVVISARVARYEIMPAYFVAALEPVAAHVPLRRSARPPLVPQPDADPLFGELLAALQWAGAAADAAFFPGSAAWASLASPASAPWSPPTSPTSSS